MLFFLIFWTLHEDVLFKSKFYGTVQEVLKSEELLSIKLSPAP